MEREKEKLFPVLWKDLQKSVESLVSEMIIIFTVIKNSEIIPAKATISLLNTYLNQQEYHMHGIFV